MSKSKRLAQYLLALIGGVLLFLSSCSKEDVTSGTPVVITFKVTEITQFTAVSGGDVTDDGGVAIVERGVCWSNTGTPTVEDSKTSNGGGKGKYESSISGLEPNTSYNLRAYATNENGTSYGNVVSFTTREIEETVDLATITLKDVVDITQNSVIVNSEISDDGGDDIITRGVCWGENEEPTIQDNKTEDGNDVGSYSSEITSLKPNTKYYVRAYATNSAGVNYSEASSFTTKEANLPTVSTNEVTDITAVSAISGGEVSDDGGDEIIARGVSWSKNDNPTIDDNKTEDGNEVGVFTSEITELEPHTTYYVSAYATNSAGTAYGDVVSFKSDGPDAPTVTTKAVTDITKTTATSGGDIVSDGGAEITALGVCWSKDDKPTIENNKTEDTEESGTYTSEITGLELNTVYYVRAYATNSTGTSYGEVVSFTTSNAITVPVGNLLFPGANFEDWDLFVSNSHIDPNHSEYFKESGFFAQSAAGEGYEGSKALYINGFLPPGSTVGTNPLMYLSKVYDGFSLEGKSKIVFYMKGTSTRSITFRLYKPNGVARYKFLLGSIDSSKDEVIIPISEGNSPETSPGNNQVGSINTGGKWIKVTLDISNLPHGVSEIEGQDLFGIRIGSATNAAGNYRYDLLLDNFTIE